jgi:hypothetical protein
MRVPREAVEFVAIAEAGVLEAQALLLCRSIRQFCGAYARCPITVVSPRAHRRPCAATLRALDGLDVEYLPLDISSSAPEYGTSFRIHTAAHVERRSGPPIVVQLDSDTLFVSEPDFSLGEACAAARPVDVKGMCTCGPQDPFDGYWRQLCTTLSVDYERIPMIRTTVDQTIVRASYNGGLLIARRVSGLFAQTERFFESSLDQMTRPIPEHLVHLHYHWLFAAVEETSPVIARLGLPVPTVAWLEAYLPLDTPKNDVLT